MECKNTSKKRSSNVSEDEYKSVIEYSDKAGQYHRTSYQVFPGIWLIYHDAHIQSYASQETRPDTIIEIAHCREGRMECHFQEEFCYVAPGDLIISRVKDRSGVTYLPLKHYHGISILMDIEQAPRCLSCFLDDVIVHPQALAEKFCGEKSFFAVRSAPCFAHIFSELYSVPAAIQKGYFKLKVLELLLFLSGLNMKQDVSVPSIYSKPQVMLAKAVSQYLIENMNQRITLEQLSEHFHVSGAHIKNIFKGVYAVPIYAYIRTLKMESAAYMIEYTDKSIMEIAGEHGYDNSSKFASAFRAVKGVTPSEYRNRKSIS